MQPSANESNIATPCHQLATAQPVHAAELLALENDTFIPERVNITDFNPAIIFTAGQQRTAARWFGEIFAKKSDIFASTVHNYTDSTYTGTFLMMAPRVDPKVFFANERTFLGMKEKHIILPFPFPVCSFTNSNHQLGCTFQYFWLVLVWQLWRCQNLMLILNILYQHRSMVLLFCQYLSLSYFMQCCNVSLLHAYVRLLAVLALTYC